MMFVIIPVFSFKLLKWAFIISVAHFMVDLVKFFIKKKIKIDDRLDALAYSLDQMIHILVIAFITATIYLVSEPISYIYSIEDILNKLQIDVIGILSWILILLIIIQPFSITIKKVLYRYKPTTNEVEGGHPNAGALIGILERCIILFMLFADQYAAIGFVLTAKSIARYNKIVDDPKFSEYYLLGTLLSTILAIVAYLVIF
jgi:magnesium-transporting ATPase (P-type)